MNRPVVIAALLMSMLMQAASLGGHWFGGANSVDALHAVLHGSGVYHHHDGAVATLSPEDDADFEALAAAFGATTPKPAQSYQLDHSADSYRHMAQDACIAAMAPPPAGFGGSFIAARSPRPMALLERALVDPFLAGPRRPPKHRA